MSKTEEVRRLIQDLRYTSFPSYSEELMLWEIDRLDLALEAHRKDVAVLRALEAGGVDNWEGYGESLSRLTDEFDNE